MWLRDRFLAESRGRISGRDCYITLLLDSMALGLLSRRESRKDLWVRLRLIITATLYCAVLLSSIAARPLKMLVFDMTRPSLYSGISAAQSTYTAFPLIMLHM